MERKPVNSTSLRSIGYDPSSQTLEVEFVSGGVYQYARVSESVYEGLVKAASHGQYFLKHIKELYPYERLK